MEYKKVVTGEIRPGKLQCVFVSVFCRSMKPYKKYQHVDDQNVLIPMTLMQMRWDGSLGFPGGKVDPEDCKDNVINQKALKTAVIREMKEEIGMKRIFIRKKNLIPLCTFQDEEADIHNFAYEVSPRMFKLIFRLSILAKHIFCENDGSIATHIANYKEKGYRLFVQNKFCATAKLELEELVNKYNLLKDYK